MSLDLERLSGRLAALEPAGEHDRVRTRLDQGQMLPMRARRPRPNGRWREPVARSDGIREEAIGIDSVGIPPVSRMPVNEVRGDENIGVRGQREVGDARRIFATRSMPGPLTKLA
jgi:hypothetical protein